MSAVLDPFNLAQLSQDIDRNITRIMARDYQKVVTEEALTELKTKLRNEANTIIVEVWNDILELQGRLNQTIFAGPGGRVPTLEQMAEQLPTVFQRMTGVPSVEQAIQQLRWVFCVWLQVCGSLMQGLAAEWPVCIEGFHEFGVVAEAIKIPKTGEIDSISNSWQMLRRLTLEYLQKKSQLLRLTGETVPSVAIELEDETDRLFIDARKAFWNNDYFAGTLMAQSLRSALIKALGLNSQSLAIPLSMIPSSQLVVLAHAAGMALPYPLETLGNMAHDLERYQDENRHIPLSLFYPVYRILEDAVQKLGSSVVEDAVRANASAMLRQQFGERADVGQTQRVDQRT